MKWINIFFNSKIENKINKTIIGKRCKAFNAINKEKLMDIISELKEPNFTIKNIYKLYKIKYGHNPFFSRYFKEIYYKSFKKYTTVKQRNNKYFTHSNNNIQKYA